MLVGAASINAAGTVAFFAGFRAEGAAIFAGGIGALPSTTPSVPTPGNTTGTGGNSDNVTTLTNDPVDGRSTRGAVLTGDNVMIAGFIITGDSAKTMLIRARGPTLADLGVSDVLHDPVLRVFSGQTVIAQNDNWRDTQEQAIAATGFRSVPAAASSRQLFLSEFRSSRAVSDLPFHGVYSNHYIVENTSCHVWTGSYLVDTTCTV